MEVKLNIKGGSFMVTDFEHAQRILRLEKQQKTNDFTVADPTKFKFINNDLIKQPKPKASKKPNKSGGSTTGGEVPK